MPFKDPAAKRQSQHNWYIANRERILDERKQYHLDNQATILLKAQKYHEEHRDEQNRKRRVRYWANRDSEIATHRRWVETHPEENKKSIAAWFKANPDRVIEHVERRRARKLNAPINDLTQAQWREIQAAYDHRCYYCGKRAKGRLTKDHIVPLAKGGSHTASNIVPACHSCNSRKRTGPPPVPVQPLLLTIAPSKKPKKEKAG